MATDRHEFWPKLLALLAIAAGLLVLDLCARAGVGGRSLPLAGLLLALYGAVLSWWRGAAATRPLQWRVARFARRLSHLDALRLR